MLIHSKWHFNRKMLFSITSRNLKFIFLPSAPYFLLPKEKKYVS